MQNTKCPKCGNDTDAPCPCSDQAGVNGASTPKWIKPPPPPELAGMVFEPVPPEMREEFLRTFNEEEYLAAVRELERTGGVQIDDLIAEMDRRLDGSA